MIHRRTFLPVAVTLLSTTASCIYFRPIDPNPPRERAPESTATAARPTPTPEQVTPTVTQPVAQTVVPPVTQPVPQPVLEPVAPPAVTQPVPQPVTTRTAPPVAQPETRRTAQPVARPTPTVRAGAIRDANIAAMVLASNNTDISYARLVPARAQRDDVKKFAERMLTDHIGVNALVTELLRKLDLGAEDNVISLDMRDESSEKRDILRELSGFAFDSTYMENEVSYHRKFLASIDNDMLPNARNGELRNLLLAIRPAVAAHMAHAEQTRANVLAKK